QVVPWKVVEFLVKNQTFPRSILFCVDSLDYSLHKITGVDRGEFQYKVEAERLSGKLLADLRYITIEEIFGRGLHEYLDRMQLRLIEINNAIYKEFCEWLEEEPEEGENHIGQYQIQAL
ncbi:MAG TPA: alpha-E domain-containing protein, partial [Chthoniobacterales bacterium]